MTQQEQQEFMESLEAALSWMRVIQERLRANDNTQGPRDALEARLRETEKIHQSQHEGRVKMDMALMAAETLLQSDNEELKNHIQSKLKDLKSLWEETCTYIVHCHSRIEWVWLHWSEYLKACEEFELWLMRQRRGLDVRVELQLGVKEKLWQVDQQRVVVSDIHSQAALLERLLDEAAALHNRTHDPSMEAQAQERMREAYKTVRDGAEERLSLLQKISEEHQTYQCCLQRFQSWLLSKTRELTDLMEREGAAENKLRALQALDDSVAGEEKTLQHIEGVAEALRANTSPAGAEVVVDEAEELRLGWQRLRQGLCEAEEGLRSSLDSHSQYVARCQRLGEDISRLRLLVHNLDQELDQELEQSCETRDPSEEQMVGQWRKYTAVRNALVGEESQVELLKTQLKELFRFSEDSRHLSDDVLAVVREHQSVKCRVTKLCSESESGLRTVLQDPLLVYAQWSHMVSQILDASAEVTDLSHIAMLVQNIERLLKDSVQLQEHLRLLQIKGDLLDSVFGPERSDSLQDDLSATIRTRELLHNQLLQRKQKLQGSISRSKDFADAYELTLSKLRQSQDCLLAAEQPQHDILAKKSQCDQFRVIQKELEDCEAHLLVLETLVCSSQNNRSQFERLHADWKHLHQAVRLKVRESEENIVEHESFHEHLLSLEKWLIIMRQRLESFLSPTGGWSLEGRQHEVQRALGEFPEKELQLQQVEAQGQGVLEKTSVEGQAYILRDLRSLQESWLALHSMSLHLHRLLNGSTEQTDAVDKTPRAEELSLGKGVSWTRVDSSRGPQQSEAAVASGASGPRRGGGLEGDAGQEETELGGWPQSHRGPLILTEQHNAHVSPSRAGTAGRLASGEDAGASRAEQRVDTPKASSFSHGEEDEPPGTTVAMGGTGQSWSRRRAFEAWLSQQNGLLAGVLATGSALPAKKLKKQQDTVKALREGVSWGQDQFQLLLQESQGSEASSGLAEDVSLEELRYRWMLYKSKLKDVGEFRTRASARTRARTSARRVQAKPEEPALTATALKRPRLLQRVCRLALPLWLLLLALLLLASLLPLMDGGSSCSLSNNFARSFNIMLRYDGPPPT